jgi:hypothetical protein
LIDDDGLPEAIDDCMASPGITNEKYIGILSNH